MRADLSEVNRQAEFDSIKSLIERFGGNVEKIDEWGRRRLSYPVGEQTEGFYTFFTFSSDRDAPKEIESRLRLMENIHRFLIIRNDSSVPIDLSKSKDEKWLKWLREH